MSYFRQYLYYMAKICDVTDCRTMVLREFNKMQYNKFTVVKRVTHSITYSINNNKDLDKYSIY